MFNSLEWSLKCNSDSDVIAETLLGLFTCLSPTGGGGGEGGGGKECVTSARRVFAITLPRERLSEIFNETPKPDVRGLSFDNISKSVKDGAYYCYCAYVPRI